MLKKQEEETKNKNELNTNKKALQILEGFLVLFKLNYKRVYFSIEVVLVASL